MNIDLKWSKACVFDDVMVLQDFVDLIEAGRIPHQKHLFVEDLFGMLTPVTINRRKVKLRKAGRGKRRRPVSEITVTFNTLTYSTHALHRLHERSLMGSHRIESHTLHDEHFDPEWMEQLALLQHTQTGLEIEPGVRSQWGKDPDGNLYLIRSDGTYKHMLDINTECVSVDVQANTHPITAKLPLNLVPYGSGAFLGYFAPSLIQSMIVYKEPNQTPDSVIEKPGPYLFNAMTYIDHSQMSQTQRAIYRAIGHKHYPAARNIIQGEQS